VVGLVVDLAAADAQRLPEAPEIMVESVKLPRLALPAGVSPLPTVLAFLTSKPAASDAVTG
jgi:hypothetical protein